MQRRPWILVVALLVLAFAFSVIVTVRYLNRSQRLRNELLKATSGIPGSISIGFAEVRPFYLILRRVSYTSEDSSVVVKSRKISLRLKVSNLLTHQGGMERIIQSIAISDPQVNIRLGRSDERPHELKSMTKPDISRFEFLEQLIVTHGRITINAAGGGSWLVLNDLEGWVRGVNFRDLLYEFHATAYDDEGSSILLSGNADLIDFAGRLAVEIAELDLELAKLPKTSPVRDLAGNLAFSGQIAFNSDTLEYSADFRWDSGAIKLKNGPNLTGITLNGELGKGEESLIGECLFEGDQAEISVKMSLEDILRVQAEMNIPEWRMGAFLQEFASLKPGSGPEGPVSAKLTFDWTPSTGNWKAVGRAEAARLGTLIGPLSDVELDLSFSRRYPFLSFDGILGTWYGLHFEGGGAWWPKEEFQIDVDLDLHGLCDATDLPDWAKPLSEKTVNADIAITKQRGSGLQVEGDGNIRSADDPSLGEIEAEYSLDGYRIRLDLFSTYQRDASIELTSGRGRARHVYTNEPHLLARWFEPEWGVPEWTERFHLTIEGDIAPETVTSSIFVQDSETNFGVSLYGSVLKQADDSVTGIYSYNLLRNESLIGNGELDFNYREKLLSVERLTFKDYFVINGAVDLENRSFEQMALVVEDLDIGDIVHRVTSLPQGSVGGKINGRLDLNGSFKQPDIVSHFELFDGRYIELAQYWGLLTLDTDLLGNLVVRDGSLGRAETILLLLSGKYNILNDELDLEIQSPGSDARVLAGALTGDDTKLRGRMSLNGRISGKLTLPSWTADLRIVGAKVLGIAFDDVALNLEGQTTERLGSVVYVRRFNMTRSDRYLFELSGAVPQRGAGEINMILSGAIMELLPQISHYFRNPRGSGELNWSFTMVAGKLAASYGSLRVDGGSVDFRDVLPGVRNLFIDVEVDWDGIATINRFDGFVGKDAEVVIRNEMVDDLDPTHMPLIIKGLDVNLGVIKMKTNRDEGLPLRIPGIMSTPDFARVTFSGLDGGEWFMVSGPADSLLFTGAMTIARTQITYPRFESGSDEGRQSTVTRLFKNARWDATLAVKEDVGYIREIRGLENAPFLQAFSGLIGQINVDLEIEHQENVPPIQIVGRVADGSFRLIGELISTRGTIEFLDFVFQMENAELVFDPTTVLPVASGRATTRIVDQETNLSRTIFLTLYVVDPVTGEKNTRGRWGEFTFMLEDDQNTSQGQLISLLVYGEEGATAERIAGIGGGAVDRALTRRLLKPIERDVEKMLGLDVVRINPNIAQRFAQDLLTADEVEEFEATLPPPENLQATRYQQATTLTLGKYLTRDVFVSYTGYLGGDPAFSAVSESDQSRFGLLQSWNLEYRLRMLSPNFILEAGWEYDNLESMDNRSLSLKYSIQF